MRKSHVGRALISAVTVTLLSTSKSLAQAFNSPDDLVVLQTNGDGNAYANDSVVYGGDSVTLLDMAISTSNSGSGITLGVSIANTTNLPTSSLSLNGSSVVYNASSSLGLVIPDSGSHPGQITLSNDGHSLELGAYLAPVGPVNYYGTQTAPDDVTPDIAPRVITVVSSTGVVTPAAALTGANDYSAVDIRQVTSLNGTQFWSVGNGAKPPVEEDIGGLRYSTSGASSTTSLNIQNDIDARTTTIYQGQMYVAGGSGNNPTGIHTLSQLGTGLNTSPQSWTPLPSNVPPSTSTVSILGDQSPCFITLPNGASILYESDSTTGAVEKWSLINGTWDFDGKIAFGKDDIENIAAKLNNDGSVSLFADNNQASYGAGNIYGFLDTGGAGLLNLSGQSFTLSSGNRVYSPGTPIYTGTTTFNSSATQTQKFWGLSFAPSSSAAVADQIWGNLNTTTGAAGGSWANSANWAAGAIPSGSGATATFGPGLTSNASGGMITLDGSQTVGHVEFNDSAVNYTIAAGASGILNINNTDPNASGVPSIFNSNGSQTISAPINLANGVTLADHYQASMNISGSIGGSGTVQIYGPGSLVLAGISTYSGATILHSGPVTVTSSGSLPVTTGLTVGDTTDTTAVGLTASITFNASAGSIVRPITLGSLSIVSNGSVALQKSSSTANRSVLVLGGLAFTGTTNAWSGKLDLSNNDLIVHNGNLANITNQIAQGYNSGQWNGVSGISSSTAAANTTYLTALGVILNANTYGSSIGSLGLFDGTSPVSTDVLVKYTYYGDANLDGAVDGSDYTLIDNGFHNHVTGWGNGDFNYDGTIDGSDYTLIDNAYNTQGLSLGTNPAMLIANPTEQIDVGSVNTSDFSQFSQAVPEPASLAWIAIGAFGMLGRNRDSTRRRRR